MGRQAGRQDTRRTRRLLAVVGLAGLWLPALAAAELPVGQPVPSFTGTDLTGTPRQSTELKGQPTVVIAATSRSASEEAQAWANRLTERYGEGVHLTTLIAIDLPFFIPESTALDMAREKIPRQYWDQTWLGGEGDIQEALQIAPGSETPYIFTVDEQGRITAGVHARVGDPQAQRIWQAVQQMR
jgi:hypothetical protein